MVPAASMGVVAPGAAKLHREVPVAALSAVTPLLVGTARRPPAGSRDGAMVTPATVADQTPVPVDSASFTTLPLVEAAYTSVPSKTGDWTLPPPRLLDQASVPAEAPEVFTAYRVPLAVPTNARPAAASTAGAPVMAAPLGVCQAHSWVPSRACSACRIPFRSPT